MKIALAQINPIIGDFSYNKKKILDAIQKAARLNADLVIFPELAVTGYPPEDLLLLPTFIETAERTLSEIIPFTKGIAAILGTVRKNPEKGEKKLLNSAAVISDGALIGFQDKSLLPDYDVFSERRYFEPATQTTLWVIKGKKIAITICEDIWQHGEAVEYTSYRRDPVKEIALLHPDLLLNLSASPFYFGRQEIRLQVASKVAKTAGCPHLLCNQVGANDSLIFDGMSIAHNAKGELIAFAKAFEEDLLIVDLNKNNSVVSRKADPLEDLFSALVLGIKDYFFKQNFKKACLGLSGGIDSALVACLAVKALGPENVLALYMPSRFSSEESRQDSTKIAKNLKIALKEISIEEPFQGFLDLLEPHFENRPYDTTEENFQARIRGILLMAFSNKFGFLVLSPGNKSEMALGYTTLYGDMCGGLSVLNDVTKEQVYALAEWINREKEIIPRSILTKPPSAELRPNQKDTDSLPLIRL